MDCKGLHGLSYKYSACGFPRHSAMNDVIKSALQKACLPSVLEPLGLDRGDGSRPDGNPVFLFSGGRSLVRISRVLILLLRYLHMNRLAMEASTAANCAKECKLCKYAALAGAHQFEPIAVEMMGPNGGSTGVILKEIGHRLVKATWGAQGG